MRWRWFLLRRELRHRVLCMRLRGHDFEWRESTCWDIDGRQWSIRCRCCDRIFPRVLTISYAMSRSRLGGAGVVEREMAKLEARMRFEKDAPQSSYEGMFA